MKTVIVACSLLILAGCASPRSSTAEYDSATEAREAAIVARAGEYQKRGLSARDARARAESDVDGLLTPQRKLEPTARTTPH